MIRKVTGAYIIHHPIRVGAAVLLGLVWGSAATQASTPVPDSGLVSRALANELKAAQDNSRPMEYRLRKATPRLISTKQIVETQDGAVARLLSINDADPSASDRQKDDARLDALLADPERQRKRKQSEQDDTGRALKVLRTIPKAFLFEFASTETSGSTTLARYTFKPNPRFDSNDLELLVLTAMSGTLTIDATHERVVRLEGQLQREVEIGWGLIGHLDRGGWIIIDQADVGSGAWRIVRLQMAMSGRVFFKSRSFDTTEEQSHFAPVPIGMTYQQAIQKLRAGSSGGAEKGR